MKKKETHKIRKYSKLILRIIGGLLIAGSIYIAYWWFYMFVPIRHLTNENWLRNHSGRARWEEEQKNYLRLGASPDLCFRGDMIAYYGNKKWLLWLIDKMENAKGFRVCGCTETALMFMTNQYDKDWGEWARKNKNKTQEEWIRDGFMRAGIKVNLPPRPEDIKPLLKVLGQKTWSVFANGPQKEGESPESVPSYIKYNAFRWLRDSGFEPIKYIFKQSSQLPKDIKLGIVEYDEWSKYYSVSGPGILSFSKNYIADDEDYLDMPQSIISQTWFIVLVYGLVIIPFIGGMLLLFWSTRKKKEAE